MRFSPALAVTVLVACFVAPADAAQAVETCQGQPATIVATNGAEGTDGDDVIVVHGVSGGHGVWGYAGDDLICLDGDFPTSAAGDAAVTGGSGFDSLDVRLGDRKDHLWVNDVESVDLDAGGGPDQITLHGSSLGSAAMEGGRGADLLRLLAYEGPVLDLAAGTLTAEGITAVVSGFRDVLSITYVGRATITGNEEANRITALGCLASIRGMGGGDTIRAKRVPSWSCAQTRTRVRGGHGDDLLVGTPDDDVLLGGPGKDTARGGPGVDRCVAETRRRCER